MKKKISSANIILVATSLVALVCILLLLYQRTPSYYQFKGTFRRGNPEIILLTDGEKNFCIYSQNDNIICTGTYYKVKDNTYFLESAEGQDYIVVQDREGAHLFDEERKEVCLYKKIANHLSLYEIEENYPEWCYP